MKLFYDLHIHSCLSPCGDGDMTPSNIAGMAALCGLQVAALTDHNTTLNCPAFFAECRKNGVVPVAGCELTTTEDIHIVCLFPTLDSALCFDRELRTRRVPVKNRPDIFGEQLILGENDSIIGCEENLLINATTLSLTEAFDFVRSFGGATYPAHVDRESNGIIAALGDFPVEPPYKSAEYHDFENVCHYRDRYPVLQGLRRVVSSDAHRLEDMRDAQHTLDIEGENESQITGNLIKLLMGERA